MLRSRAENPDRVRWQEPIAGRPRVQQLLRMQKQQQQQQQQQQPSPPEPPPQPQTRTSSGPSATPSSSQRGTPAAKAVADSTKAAEQPERAQPDAQVETPYDLSAGLDSLFDALDRDGQGHLEENDTREMEATLAAGWPPVEHERLVALLRPSGGTRVYRQDFATFFTEAALYLFEQLAKGSAMLSGEKLMEVSDALGLEHEPMMSAGFAHFVVANDLTLGLPKDRTQ